VFESERTVEPSLQVDLLGASVEEMEEDEFDREGVFCVSSPLFDHARSFAANHRRASADDVLSYHFQAPNEEALLAWLEAFEDAVLPINDKDRALANACGRTSGHMTKQSGGKHAKKNWRKRWFCLADDSLYYYKDSLMQDLKGAIFLGGAMVQEASNSNHPYLLCINTSFPEWGGSRDLSFFVGADDLFPQKRRDSVSDDAIAARRQRHQLTKKKIEDLKKQLCKVGGVSEDGINDYLRVKSTSTQSADVRRATVSISVEEEALIRDLNEASVEVMHLAKEITQMESPFTDAGRTYYLSVTSAKERTKWIRAIQEASQQGLARYETMMTRLKEAKELLRSGVDEDELEKKMIASPVWSSRLPPAERDGKEEGDKENGEGGEEEGVPRRRASSLRPRKSILKKRIDIEAPAAPAKKVGLGRKSVCFIGLAGENAATVEPKIVQMRREMEVEEGESSSESESEEEESARAEEEKETREEVERASEVEVGEKETEAKINEGKGETGGGEIKGGTEMMELDEKENKKSDSMSGDEFAPTSKLDEVVVMI